MNLLQRLRLKEIERKQREQHRHKMKLAAVRVYYSDQETTIRIKNALERQSIRKYR
jgi:hypothetical protein